MKIWLDDERPMPDYFEVHAKTSQEAIELLKTGKVTSIGFDHDLGSDSHGTGYDVAVYLEQAVIKDEIPMPEVSVHTQNPVGRERICMALRNAWNHTHKQA
jgi:hypothetical protein